MRALIMLLTVLSPAWAHAESSLDNLEDFALHEPASRWSDYFPFVSVMGGVGTNLKGGSAILGVQAGLQLPLGIRLSATTLVAPYFSSDPNDRRASYPTISEFGTTMRVGWGLWIESVYVGAQVGGGIALSLHEDGDDTRLEAQNTPEGIAVIEWHVSDTNFLCVRAACRVLFMV